MAWSRFDFYHLIILLMVAITECKQCGILNRVETVLNSVVTLQCPLTPWLEVREVIWEVLQGDRAERVGSVTNCSTSCTIDAKNNRAQQSPCRMRTMEDLQNGSASLIISPVEIADAIWYRCTVQNRIESYCYEVKIAVKDELQLQTPVKECKKINPFEAVLNEAFKLQCPVARSHLGASQLIWGTVEDVPIPITRCPSHCTTSGTKKPLCERTKTMEDGSLTISPVWSTDSQWFWCALTGNSTSCFTFRLYVKGVATANHLPPPNNSDGGDVHTTLSPQEQTNCSNCTVYITNATMIIIISTISVFLFVAMLVGGYCFRKRKKKNTVELENPYEDIKENINTDFCQYSLVQYNPAILYTFKEK